jgi:A/G-specific adenine glycosylase
MLRPIPDLRRRLLAWYAQHRRDLPWRLNALASERPDAYHVLLSEFMLQQTQVATVIPYFTRFLEAFPTIAALAAADEERVLRLWQGLGYYSRARNLLRAAKAVVERFDGKVPTTVDNLLTLPGIGRYTAGAIASIAHGTRAPIVDGNVIRVLCRLDAIRDDPRTTPALAALWVRAEELVPRAAPGDFNSAMMELGATVCVPRNPQCLICPVAATCEARELGIQDQIPPPKKARPTPLERRTIYCCRRQRDDRSEFAFEQRPANGRWAGLWQFITRPADAPLPGVDSSDAIPLGRIEHGLTHRRYEFDVMRVEKDLPLPPTVRWLTLEESETLPLPKPHVRARELLRSGPLSPVPGGEG